MLHLQRNKVTSQHRLSHHAPLCRHAPILPPPPTLSICRRGHTHLHTVPPVPLENVVSILLLSPLQDQRNLLPDPRKEAPITPRRCAKATPPSPTTNHAILFVRNLVKVLPPEHRRKMPSLAQWVWQAVPHRHFRTNVSLLCKWRLQP